MASTRERVLDLLWRGRQTVDELARELGLTDNAVRAHLVALERDGLVVRTVYPTTPPSVGYRLTPLGQSAAELHDAIVAWALRHSDEILASRASYDDRRREDSIAS